MARASAKFDAEDKPAPAKPSSVVSTNSLVSASWAHTIFFQALLSLLTVWLPLCAETTPTRTLLELHRGMDTNGEAVSNESNVEQITTMRT